MKQDKHLGRILLAVGAVLFATGLVLILLISSREAQAQKEAAQAAASLDAMIAAREALSIAAEETASTEATDPTDPPTLTSELLDGHEYVGYLDFPSLDRRLPVMKIKYLEDLQIAPCLERGSPHTDDAVICAHNYPAHFGPIRDWKGGEEVIFTDLEGNAIHYTVSLVQTIAPTDVEAVMESDHDLVLYTCTPGGAKRVMIACDRTE